MRNLRILEKKSRFLAKKKLRIFEKLTKLMSVILSE
jgi:hypothetical protein